MQTIHVGAVLIEESPRMTQVLGLESEPYSGNWCLNKATPENRPLTRGTRQVLTHFLASTTLAALTKGRPQEF